jgi:uncharacterized protein YmfQ (DUF2313 family)
VIADRDLHLRRLLGLLPPGRALPQDPAAEHTALLRPIAAEFAHHGQRIRDLLEEYDPRTATELLPDFERVLGPDPCGTALPLTLPERRRVVHARWTQRGGQSIAYFVGLAASYGVAITIEERRPFKAGASKAGHPVAPRACRFVWRVRLPATRAITFRAGASRAGQSLGRIVPVGVECPITRLAPAHTVPVFSYGDP